MKVSSSRLEWVFLSIIVISQSSLLVRKLNRATGLGRLALMLSAEGFQVEANVSWPTKPCVRPIYLRSPRRGMCSPKTNFHRSPRMLLACFSPLLTISWTEHQKNRWCSFPWRTSSRRIMVGGPLRIWTEVVFTPSKWDFFFFFGPLWGHAQQYTQISVPSIAPENLVNLVKSDQTRCSWRDVFFLLLNEDQPGHHFELFQAILSRPTRRADPLFWIWLAIFADFFQIFTNKNTSEKNGRFESTQFIEFTMEFTQQFNRTFWIQKIGCKLIILLAVGKLKKSMVKCYIYQQKPGFFTFCWKQIHSPPGWWAGLPSLWCDVAEDDGSRIFLEMAVLLTHIREITY